MVEIAALLGFAAAVTPMVLTPGASFTLVSDRGLRGDHSGALATIAGTAAGILTHAALAGIGLALIVMRSAQAYAVIRILGAIYLIGLGVSLLWRARRNAENPLPSDGPEASSGGSRLRAGGQAYIANVLNVKASTVYLTLAPQFIGSDQVGVLPMVELALVHVAVMAAWLSAWAFGIKQVTARFDPHRWRRAVNRIGGAVLIGLGVRTATTH